MPVVQAASGIDRNQHVVTHMPGIGIVGFRVASNKLRRAENLPGPAS